MWKQAFKRALSAPWLYQWALFFSGVAAGISFSGAPALHGEAAAGWASALGTLAAAFVALGLGVRAAQEEGRRQRARAAAAAILATRSLHRVRALVDIIEEHKVTLLANRGDYAPWLATLSARLQSYDPIIDERINPFLLEMPTTELRLLVGADNAFNDFRNRHLFPQPTTLAEIFKRFDSFIGGITGIRPIVVAASNSIHELSGLDAPPPWESMKAAVAPNPDG